MNKWHIGLVAAIVFSFGCVSSESTIVYDSNSLNVHPNQLNLNPNECTNGFIAREIGTNEFVYTCRPDIKPTITQGLFGHTTIYSTIYFGNNPYIPETERLYFIPAKVSIARFNFDTNKFEVIQELETTLDNNGFFQVELPEGSYFPFIECNQDYFTDINSRLNRFYGVKERKLEKLYLYTLNFIINVGKNQVVEASAGVHCTLIGQ